MFEFWNKLYEAMSGPILKIFYPPQIVDPTAAARAALADGEIVEATANKIVFEDDAGNKITLYGWFGLGEGDEPYGTIKGFVVEDNGHMVASGRNLNVDAPTFLTAVEDDPRSAMEMVTGDTGVILGSKYGDEMYVGGSPKAELAALAEDAEDEMPIVAAFGLDGDDTMMGGEGQQILNGGRDSDTLYGGRDGVRDFLIGGKDGDFFIVDAPPQPKLEVKAIDADAEPEPGPEVDFILDFKSGEDLFVFTGEVFGESEEEEGGEAELLAIAPFETGFISPDQFVKGPVATTEDQRFVYNKWSGELFVDQDGSGGDYDQVLVANFTPGTHLEASDIYVQGGELLT